MASVVEHPSTTFDDRKGAPIDILLMHYTGMPDAAGALARLSDPNVSVSAHYLVDEDGTIYRMVDERQRAWHAGVSYWAGETDINARSIGIEIVNPGHEWGYRDFPDAQMDAVIDLSKDIVGRHPIPPDRIIGHSDVAPARKQDPGEKFDWARLAAHGLGLWLDPDDFGAGRSLSDEDWLELRAALEAFGYQVDAPGASDDELASVVQAFQRHYDPKQLGQQADNRTLSLVQALLSEKAKLETTTPKV